MSSTERKKLEPPTHLEPSYLYEKYEPLRKAMYSKYRDRMQNAADREDLSAAIDISFLELVNEYNPNRGVDFPYYIKRMLDLRTGHHVTKHLKNVNKEYYSEDELIVEDNSFQDVISRIVDLNSLNPDIMLGDKHRRLMVGLVIENKTLKELAEEEGVPSDRLHARLYFLLKKMQKAYDEEVALYGKDMY
jgi:RNA polymerase sigma factor (sigma-70 family)